MSKNMGHQKITQTTAKACYVCGEKTTSLAELLYWFKKATGSLGARKVKVPCHHECLGNL